MLPKSIEQELEQKIPGFQCYSAETISGGDINSAALIDSNKGDFFIKWNYTKDFPDMFEKEALGLKLLADSNTIKIPEVITTGIAGRYNFLVLEYLKPDSKDSLFFHLFGKSLGQMHKNFGSYFGLDHNNYIGSLPQINEPKDNWIEFFIINRLEYQLKMAKDNSLVDSSILRKFDRLFPKLDSLIPKEKASLLHGDLWGGNYLASRDGAALFDPAVYYGHREVDIAMSKLFGGFDSEFYEAYNQEYPLEKGWEERVDLFNLYPLLVHLNIFGKAYQIQISRILSNFV
jgi:fructosamine-3-kinase